MLSERDQSETNNALRVLFRYCYATQVRSRILSPRLKPFILFYYYYFFFLTVSFTQSPSCPTRRMLGAKGSAQWTMGKEKAGELLPSLPSYNNNNDIIIIYIIIIIIKTKLYS